MHLYASFYQYHFDRTFPVVPQIERCAVLLYFQSVCFHEKGTPGIFSYLKIGFTFQTDYSFVCRKYQWISQA